MNELTWEFVLERLYGRSLPMSIFDIGADTDFLEEMEANCLVSSNVVKSHWEITEWGKAYYKANYLELNKVMDLI